LPRFVVLHHTGHGEPHFDLMLEVDGEAGLRAWRLSSWPPGPGMTVTPLPGHRRVYLEYEGPVSRDRGQVRRVAAGTWSGAVESPVLQLDTQDVINVGLLQR
jgi:hypothetical protein